MVVKLKGIVVTPTSKNLENEKEDFRDGIVWVTTRFLDKKLKQCESVYLSVDKKIYLMVGELTGDIIRDGDKKYMLVSNIREETGLLPEKVKWSQAGTHYVYG